jgi:hypothetical protein
VTTLIPRLTSSRAGVGDRHKCKAWNDLSKAGVGTVNPPELQAGGSVEGINRSRCVRDQLLARTVRARRLRILRVGTEGGTRKADPRRSWSSAGLRWGTLPKPRGGASAGVGRGLRSGQEMLVIREKERVTLRGALSPRRADPRHRGRTNLGPRRTSRRGAPPGGSRERHRLEGWDVLGSAEPSCRTPRGLRTNQTPRSHGQGIQRKALGHLKGDS